MPSAEFIPKNRLQLEVGFVPALVGLFDTLKSCFLAPRHEVGRPQEVSEHIRVGNQQRWILPHLQIIFPYLPINN